MILHNNHPVSAISWLSSFNGRGVINNYYEPESLEELRSLCISLYKEETHFELIGHTSNTLYDPDFSCANMVSTRRINKYEIREDCIYCECGVSVRAISIAATNIGIKGFEGLCDLPGTIAAALYGNAGCFGCSISSILLDARILLPNGEIISVKSEWFEFSNRSSILKKGDKKGVILSARLRRDNGDKEILQAIASKNHLIRKTTQPEAKNSLGTIYSKEGDFTILHYIISAITLIYGFILRLVGTDKNEIKNKRKHLTFCILGATDVEPYVRSWNWYQWNNEESYVLFWKYVRLHSLMYKNSVFEIEIKQ